MSDYTVIQQVNRNKSGGGLTEVSHDATLTGKGTVAEPLKVVNTGGSAVLPPIAIIDYPSTQPYAGSEFEGFIDDIPDFLTTTHVKAGLKYTTTKDSVSTLHEVTEDIPIPTNVADGYYTVWIDKDKNITLDEDLSLINNTSKFYYNITEGNLYENGVAVEKCPIGKLSFTNNSIDDGFLFYKGTVATIPVNNGANIGVNTTYIENIPFFAIDQELYIEIFAENKWGFVGIGMNGYGTAGKFNSSELSISTLVNALCRQRYYEGSDFTADITSAKCKVTVKRGY